MKKQAKTKFLSILIALVMVLSCAVPAFAVEDDQLQSNAPEVTEAVETTDLQISPEAVENLTQSDVTYKDGIYEGTGTGFSNGAINLKVTITGGKISKVELVSQEKQSYWTSKNVASLFDKIVEANSPEVEGVSGATRSSEGVKAAVRDALSKAETTTPDPSDDTVFDSGNGTKQNPYLIKTVAQLQAFAKAVNGGETYQGQYVSLNNDLDLTGIDWTPIGSSGVFKGIFDGGSYTIENMTFGTKAEPAEKENVGLFGDLGDGGVIRNVGVKNAVVYNTYQGSQNIGLIASGAGQGIVLENCWATGTITSTGNLTDAERYSYIGGLIGSTSVKSLIANCWANVTIASSSGTENSVGGIVGSTGNNSLVINCAAFGMIGDTSDGMVSGTGGVVGFSAGAVYACYSDTALTREQSSYEDGADVAIGGVVGGNASSAAAYSCYFNADAKQSYYDGEVAEPVAVGASYGYASDNGNCEGLSAADIQGDAILQKLTAALTADQLTTAQTWFAKNVFSSDSGMTLDIFLSMTEGGWNGWEKGTDGRLLPTGASTVLPEEPDYFDGGDGSKADPYVISSEEHLRKFAEATVNGKLITANKYFKLGADIALNGDWTPIHNFAGSFDGDNHTVSGVTIGTEASPVDKTEVGFFDSLPAGASVQSLNITGAAIYANASGKYDNASAGVLAGAVKSVKIDNCTVQGSMVSVNAGNFAYSGGLVGQSTNDTYVSNCIADVPVKAVSATNAVFAGGLLGKASDSNLVVNCAALGNVTASGVSSKYNNCAAGGLIGYSSFLVENCYAAGNVTLSNSATSFDAYTGALIGKQGGGVAVDSHYDAGCVLTVNDTAAETVAAVGDVKKWDYADKNKITAEDTDAKAFVATMNAGIAETALAETDTYLTSYPFNNSTNIFADVISVRKTIALNNWALTGGKVVFGEAEAPIFASGEGTQENPYIIKTEAQLRAFAAATAEDTTYSDCYVALDADIALQGEWTPIHSFAGNFDGRNHTVSGLTIGTASAPKELTSAGFFDYLGNTATVGNLKLTGVAIYVQMTGMYNRCFAGALVGGANSIGRNVTIDHCSVTGSAVSVKSESYSFAGGLIGQLANDAVITNCWADIPVSAIVPETVSMGTSMAGGLIASNGNYSMIANCAALGNVMASGVNFNANSSSYAGGLGGQLTGLIQNCYAAGNLSLTNKTKAVTPYVGGLVGQLSMGTAVDGYFNSKATATVNGEAATLDVLGAKTATSATHNIMGKTTGTTTFTATMNSGLSKAGMAAADAWLTSDEGNYKQVELDAMRPAVWYGWTLQNNKVLLSAKAYEEPKDPVDVFDSGSGTEADPWIIKTADQWSKFADSFSDTDYAGKYIALGADITLNKGQTPAGNVDAGLQTFKGVFDGRNHTVSGLEIGSASAPVQDTKPQMYFGLFAELENATVKNLGVKDAKIYVTSEYSIMAGPLAGFTDNATVDGCWATGTVVVKTTTSDMVEYNSYAGGLVGYSQYSNIVNSWTNTSLDAYCKTANAEAGGIAGLTSFGLVANCYTLGDVSGETDRTVDDGGVAYLGGIVGCQASTLVNCYTTTNATARSWTQYVGAIAGMATAISKTYDSYYSENVKLTIVGSTVNPPVALGRTVPLGYNENGEFMSGALVDGLEALPALNTKALADKLNANFSSFPADTNTLGLSLKKWVVSDKLVTFGEETADVTYKPIAPPTQEVKYKDGTYYGRDTAENVIVAVTVEDSKVTSAKIVSPENFDAANAKTILDAVVADQTVNDASAGSSDDKALKGALVVALNKALLGDTSGYDTADPEKIFDGGEGTAAKPYQIRTADQLRAFAAAVNEDEHFGGEYIVLTADIDLAGSQWVPVGNAGAHYFGGIFDGQNHKISNMVIGTAANPVDYVSSGLFACLDGAVVRNLGVQNASIVAKRNDSTAVYGGIIAAVVDNSQTGGGCLINNCTVSGSVSVSTMNQSYAGGIAGYTWHSIVTNCGANVNLTTASSGNTAYGGGLVALDGFSIIANSYALGSITAEAGVNSATIGGIAGMQAGVAGNVYADMSLKTNNTTADIGSLVGRNTGIGVLSYGYYNSEKKLQNGSVEQDAKDVGVNVTMVTTGEIKNTEGKTGAYLHSQELADLLIHNQCEEESLRSDLSTGISGYGIVLREGAKITIDNWKLDGTIVKQNNAPQVDDPAQEAVAAPEISPNGGSFTGSQKVTITCATEGAEIYYTTDGSTPTTSSTLYSEPITLTATTTIKAIAVKDGMADSAVTTASFTKSTGGGGGGGGGTTTTTYTVTVAKAQNGTVKADRSAAAAGQTVTVTVTPDSGYALDKIAVADSNGNAVTLKENSNGSYSFTMPGKNVTVTASFAKSGSNSGFRDVPEDAYFAEAVKWAVDKNITTGTSAITFSPDESCTRAQMAVFLWRAAGSPEAKNASSFADVAADAYYAKAVAWAVENGITKGTDATHFSPEESCTRAQMATFLYRYAKTPAVKGDAPFADVAADAYYAKAVAWAVENGVTNGTDATHFSPDDDCTRAQIVTFLFRLLGE